MKPNELDLEEMLPMYNKIHKVNYKTVKHMLYQGYRHHKTLERFAEVLGISRITLTRHMKLHDIKIKPRGSHQPVDWRGHSFKTKTAKQAAQTLGCAVSTFYTIARKNGIKFRRIK